MRPVCFYFQTSLRSDHLDIGRGIEALQPSYHDAPLVSETTGIETICSIPCRHPYSPSSLPGFRLSPNKLTVPAEPMLKDAGFQNIRRHILPHGPMNVWFMSHKV